TPPASHHLPLPSFPTRRSSDLRGRDPAGFDPFGRVDVPPRQLADGHELPDAELGHRAADLAVIGRRIRTELCHLAEHGHPPALRSEEHTSELQSLRHLVCRLLL